MSRYKEFVFVLLAILFLSSHSLAAEHSLSNSLEQTTISAETRTAWQNDLSVILNRSEFAEIDDFKTIFWNAVWRKIFEFLSDDKMRARAGPIIEGMGQIMEVGIWLLFALFLVLLVLAILRRTMGGKGTEAFTVSPLKEANREELQNILRRKLDEALQKKQWLDALRYRYTLLVENLVAKNAIQTKSSSTFGDVEGELTQYRPSARTSIEFVTTLMNVCLYGHKEAEKSDYLSLEQNLRGFEEQA